MAWIAVDLDDTLISEKTNEPEPGAVEAMTKLVESGHRVSIWTARFLEGLQEGKSEEKIKADVEKELQTWGIPYSDIWTGPVKPNVDVFIGDNLVPYAGNWPLTLAQAHMLMEPTKKEFKDPEEIIE